MKHLTTTSKNMNMKMKYACMLAAAFGCAATTQAALTTNLVGYYQFESDLTDSSGNGNDATSTFTWDTGVNATGPGFTGNAAFDGGDGLSDRGTLLVGNSLNVVDANGEYITVPLGTTELGTAFTISAWTYLAPGASNGSPRFHAFEASNNWDVSWGTVNGDTDNMIAYVGQVLLSPEAPVTHETWQHVAHVFTTEGANTRLTVYVDGTSVITGTTATGNMNFAALHFGDYRAGTSDRDWDGMLDEVAIWDRALDTTEITGVYQAGLAGVAIPEPSSSAFLIGLGGVAFLLRRRQS